MYECQMKMLIPPGVGLLVAGLASGICFLIIGTLRKRKGEKSIDDSRCACCLKPFLVGRGVECSNCHARSCRKGCCRWDSVDNAWFCLFCYHSRSWSRRKENWFKSFGGLPVAESEDCKNFSTAKSKVYDEGAENVVISSKLELAAGGCKERDSMETVREFVEKIVEGLIGNVDDTPIDRLYDHAAYDRLFEAYGVPLASALTRLALSLRLCVNYKPATDTPTMAHTALRELVERAVDEARKLPGLGATVSAGPQDDASFSEQNYEDLLATAILNKVIEKFQNERVDGNSNVLYGRPRSKLDNFEREGLLENGREDSNCNLEALSHDDLDGGESEPQKRQIRLRQKPLSLTIEEQIEEVTTTYTSDEESRSPKSNVLEFHNARRVPFPEFGMDIIDPSQDSSEDSQEEFCDLTHVNRITPVESWEENWLFQKRKIQTQSEPVAMLVPNPSSDFRALIGDKDAEDTSDLSEFSAQSDDEVEDEELAEAINKVIPKSRTVEETCERAVSTNSSRQANRDNGSASWEDGLDVNRVSRPRSRDDRCRKKMGRPAEILSEDTSELYLIHKPSTEEMLKTSETQSTIRYSSPEKNLEIEPPCNEQLPSDKVTENSSIDEEKETTKETSEMEVAAISEGRSEDKTEKRQDGGDGVLSSSEIKADRHSQRSTTNGCLSINCRGVDDEEDGLEIGTSQGFNGVGQDMLANSTKAENKSNGIADVIDDSEFIANEASSDSDRKCQALAQAKADSALRKTVSDIEVNENSGLTAPPRPGTIAEREHKKWENAAPIENNPYSEENIQKRLLERQYARRSSDVSG